LHYFIMVNKKILLITTSVEDGSREPPNENNHYPLGLAYIHSYLEQNGYEVKLLFLNEYPFDECKEIIIRELESFDPRIIGLQIISHNRVSSYRMIEYIHENRGEVAIVIGGIHASIMHEQILKKYPFLTAVIGEGEATMLELAGRIVNSESIEGVNGIAYVRNGVVERTPARALIDNLDILPFPKHELFFKSGKRKVASMVTTRGCPYKCSFCCLDILSRRKVRYRSVKNVVDEIEYLYKNFPALKKIWIHDDTFCIDNERAIRVCNEIVSRKIKLQFVCSAKFKPISKEMIDAMEKAGFIQMLFGLETGSPRVLKATHKAITTEDVISAVNLLKGSKIETTAFLIVGLYGENDESIKETARLVQEMQKIKYFYYNEIGTLGIYPGTEIYEIAKRAGAISDDFWMTDKPVPLFTVEHSVEDLERMKETLLNSIAIRKARTLAGFLAQYKVLLHVFFHQSNVRNELLREKIYLPLSRLAGKLIAIGFLIIIIKALIYLYHLFIR